MAARLVKWCNSTAKLEERSLTLKAQYHQSVPSLILIAASRTNRDTSGFHHAQIDKCQTARNQSFWTFGYGTSARRLHDATL